MNTHIKRIVVGVDGSEAAGDAVEWAVDLARELGSEVVAVYAIAPLSYLEYQAVPVVPTELDPAWQANMKKIFETKWCRPLRDAGVSFRTVVREGRPPDVITAVTEAEDADLVVVGRRGRGQIAELVLGSVSHELSHRCRKPIVIVSHDRNHAGQKALATVANA